MMNFNKYVTILKEKLFNGIGFPLSDILTETIIQQALKDEQIKYRERLYTPTITLWTWIYQVLNKDKSCKNAVSFIISYLTTHTPVLKEKTPSPDTGAYCKARKRLKEGFIMRLLNYTGKYLQTQNTQLWCGRRVFIVDGSTVTMDDTEPNQKEYPQPESQAKGCGFPMANIVAIFCLNTGALLQTIIDALFTHELNLFRRLYEYLQSGDIALGDRLYSSYADICLLKSRDIDCVFRMHQKRKVDFRTGKILGIKDHIVTWTKPKSCPSGLDKALFAILPQNIKLREIRFRVETNGFRSLQITIVTTLLDASLYPKDALAELYSMRWNVEIDLRHLKTTMQMEHLSTKTPQMVRNDYYVHLLAYNLIRILMFQSGKEYGVSPLELSFCASIQHLLNFSFALAYADKVKQQNIYNVLLYIVSKERILIRVGRAEPRLKKRRPKSFGWLKQPREQLQKQFVA
jgi:hypothetical protein